MDKVIFDYSKLCGKIIEKYKTRQAFASALGLDNSTLSFKLNNKNSFTQDEIYNACLLLEIPQETLGDYFFTEEVRK